MVSSRIKALSLTDAELKAEVEEMVKRALNPSPEELRRRKEASDGIDRLAEKLRGSGLSSVEIVRELRGERGF